MEQSQSETRHLKIKTLSNTFFELTVPQSMLISELKLKIEEKTQIPVDKQRLICMGKQLQDTQTVGSYTKEDPTWIHLVGKPPGPEPAANPTAATSNQAQIITNPVNPQQAPPTQINQSVQSNQGQFGQINSLIGHLNGIIDINISHPMPPTILQHNLLSAQLTQNQANPQANNAQRQVTLPHQELLNLGNICNTLMGGSSSFPGPPLPMIPQQRNPAQIIGSFLSNWQFQVQRILPYVHRLGELLQREPYMTTEEDRESTTALSTQIGAAFNELIACTQPMIPHLRDLQLNSAPGQARFGFQQPSQPTSQPQSQRAGGSVVNIASISIPQVNSAENPLASLFNFGSIGNPISQSQTTSQQQQEQRIPNPVVESQRQNQPTQQSQQPPQSANQAQGVSEISNIMTGLNGALQNLIGGIGAGQSTIPGSQAASILQVVNNFVNQSPSVPIPTRPTSTSNSNSNQPSNIPATSDQPVSVSSSISSQTENSVVEEQPAAQEQVALNSEQPNLAQLMQGNPLALLMGGGGQGGMSGLLGGIMNMSLNDILNNDESEIEVGSGLYYITKIFGDIRFNQFIQNSIAGRFDYLDQVQTRMRDLIVDKDLNREGFVESAGESFAEFFEVPEEHADMVFEGLDTKIIAKDILVKKLPTFYDLIFRDFPVEGIEKFSSEFIYELMSASGELFYELSECLQGGIADMEVIFKKQLSKVLTATFGEQMGMIQGMMIVPLIWNKVKQRVLTHQQDLERRQNEVEEESKRQDGDSLEGNTGKKGESEDDLLEEIEVQFEKDSQKKSLYQEIGFSSEYKLGSLSQNTKPQ